MQTLWKTDTVWRRIALLQLNGPKTSSLSAKIQASPTLWPIRYLFTPRGHVTTKRPVLKYESDQSQQGTRSLVRASWQTNMRQIIVDACRIPRKSGQNKTTPDRAISIRLAVPCLYVAVYTVECFKFSRELALQMFIKLRTLLWIIFKWKVVLKCSHGIVCHKHFFLQSFIADILAKHSSMVSADVILVEFSCFTQTWRVKFLGTGLVNVA